MIPDYMLGTVVGTAQSTVALGLPYPRAEAVDYAIYIDCGDGTQQGHGWLVAYWRFDALTVEEYNRMLSFVGTVYIKTLTHQATYVAYNGRLIAPPRKAPKDDMILDAVFEFRDLVAA